MLAKPVRKDEQIKLIMECRQSGLTDYEWCNQRGINVGTFYNWFKRLKQVDGITIPRTKKPDAVCANKQEVVKLDVLNSSASLPGVNDQYNNSVTIDNGICTVLGTASPQAIKLNLSFGSVEIPNGTDPSLLEVTLRILGGIYAG